MSAAFVTFAQAQVQAPAPGPEKAANPGGGVLDSPIPVMLLVLAAMATPPTTRRRSRADALEKPNLKKNDEVLTSSGFIGIVANLREGEDEVTIKLDDNCKVRMKRTSIVQILKAKDAPAGDAKPTA